jgi:hypothetical protein
MKRTLLLALALFVLLALLCLPVERARAAGVVIPESSAVLEASVVAEAGKSSPHRLFLILGDLSLSLHQTLYLSESPAGHLRVKTAASGGGSYGLLLANCGGLDADASAWGGWVRFTAGVATAEGSAVSTTEFGYLDGVTGALQGQLDGKAATSRKLDDFGAPDANTDLNVSTSAHGLCPMLDNNVAHFLNGQGGYTTPAGGGDVLGPATSTDHSLIRANGTDNKTVQGSGAICDDSNNLSGIGSISAAAGGFIVDADGDVTLKSLTVTRVAGASTIYDLFEWPANGNNKVSLTVPATLGADYNVTVPAYNGTVPILVDGTAGNNYVVEADPIPVGYMIDGTAAPAAIATLTSTRKVNARAFDPSSAEDLEFPWQAPQDLYEATANTLNWRPVYVISNSTAPASNEGVCFSLAGCSNGDSDAMGCTLGTASASATADLNGHAQYDIVYGPWAAVVVTNLAAGELVMFNVNRTVANANDDYAQDVNLVGIEVEYARTLSNAF